MSVETTRLPFMGLDQIQECFTQMIDRGILPDFDYQVETILPGHDYWEFITENWIDELTEEELNALHIIGIHPYGEAVDELIEQEDPSEGTEWTAEVWLDDFQCFAAEHFPQYDYDNIQIFI